MTIGPLPAASATAPVEPHSTPQSAAQEQVGKTRELAKAIRALNENAVSGPGSELRFAIDQDTGRGLIRIVDKVTNEVITQIPAEDILRMAAELSQLNAHTRLA
jgi:flagellar protein FlaG